MLNRWKIVENGKWTVEAKSHAQILACGNTSTLVIISVTAC